MCFHSSVDYKHAELVPVHITANEVIVNSVCACYSPNSV